MTVMQSTWCPILSGETAKKAWEGIHCVCESIARIKDWSIFGGSLAGGASGAALLFGYLADVTGDEAALNTCKQLQRIAVEQLAANHTLPSLFAGFSGIGWAGSHLHELLDPEGEDPASEIDAGLLFLLDRPRWVDDYDLIAGLVGFGVYGLERLKKGRGQEILAHVITHLERLAIAKEEGFAWLTPPHHLPLWQREKAPAGYWNLGLAHGIPGVLAFLGQAVQVGVETERAKRLLEGGMAWFLARRNPVGSLGWFATHLPEGKPWPGEGSRIAWCYGDLGVSTALLQAAQVLGREGWTQLGLQVALDAAKRPRTHRGVLDAVVCHGAAGNALMFMRLFHATGMEPFREAALDHLEWTMSMREPDQAFGGFPQHRLNDDRHSTFQYNPGLLEGGAGVAMVLLAALTHKVPDWDRHLLVSLQPRS